MRWLVVQLTLWAEKHLTTLELAKELRRRTIEDLELFYPSTEDVVGKHNTAYSEYCFVEYRDGVDYTSLEGGDIFKSVLKEAHNGPVQLLDDSVVVEIRGKLDREQILQPGDKVNIHQGPLAGNIGTVQSDLDGYTSLTVLMGEMEQDAVVPRKWVRRLGKKKKSASAEDIANLKAQMNLPEKPNDDKNIPADK